jgi:hypothetical protein
VQSIVGGEISREASHALDWGGWEWISTISLQGGHCWQTVTCTVRGDFGIVAGYLREGAEEGGRA